MKALPLLELTASLPEGTAVCHFDRKTITKDGKKREISIPNEGMMLLHGILQARLQPVVVKHKLFMSAYGAVPGRNAFKNAVTHIGGRFFYQIDIASAYPSVDLIRLAEALVQMDETLGSFPDVSLFLHEYCAAVGGGLATGGPASPMLFNIYCGATIDPHIRKLCSDPNTCYTRYVDDLTISSARPLPSIFRKRVRGVVTSAGFTLSEHKSKLSDVRLEDVLITGVVIGRNSTVRPDGDYIRRLTEKLRIPSKEMSRPTAASFSGLAGHLYSFGKSSSTIIIPNDVWSLRLRCQKKLATLQEEGLLPKKHSRRERFFSSAFLNELQTRAPIQQVAMKYTTLQKRGRDLAGRCPFHGGSERKFCVSPAKGIYHCFICGVGGDVFQLVRDLENVSFPQAVERIARDHGVPLPTKQLP